MIAAIYSRVSTEREVQKDSLTNQEAIIRDVIRGRGWEAYSYVYKESKSGTKANREEIMKLMADAKAGKFNVIVAKELSRLARNQEFAMHIIKQLKILGVHLVTLDGAIDTTKNASDVTGLFSWLYEFESSKISQRIKRVYVQKQKDGLFLGSNAPYGYSIKDKKLTVKEDNTPDIVRRIFSLFQEGNGFDRIARILYEEDIPTPSQVAGKKNASIYWHGSSVRKILENRNYTGDLIQGKETTYDVTIHKRKVVPKSEHIIVEGSHEAIISKEEFELVQELIQKRRRQAHSNPNVKTKPHEIRHLFTEILVCGTCGKNYHYKSNRRNEYICGLYNKHGSKACKPNSINEDALIKVIKDDLQKFSSLINHDKLYKIIHKKQKEKQVNARKRINQITKELDGIINKKVQAMDMLMEGTFTKVQFDSYIKSQDEVSHSLNSELNGMEHQMTSSVNDLKIDEAKKMIDEILSFENWSRALMVRFVDKIVVKGKNDIQIHYRFSSTLKELNDLMEIV